LVWWMKTTIPKCESHDHYVSRARMLKSADLSWLVIIDANLSISNCHVSRPNTLANLWWDEMLPNETTISPIHLSRSSESDCYST
jgi:hypothetical protein